MCARHKPKPKPKPKPKRKPKGLKFAMGAQSTLLWPFVVFDGHLAIIELYPTVLIELYLISGLYSIVGLYPVIALYFIIRPLLDFDC